MNSITSTRSTLDETTLEKLQALKSHINKQQTPQNQKEPNPMISSGVNVGHQAVDGGFFANSNSVTTTKTTNPRVPAFYPASRNNILMQLQMAKMQNSNLKSQLQSVQSRGRYYGQPYLPQQTPLGGGRDQLDQILLQNAQMQQLLMANFVRGSFGQLGMPMKTGDDSFDRDLDRNFLDHKQKGKNGFIGNEKRQQQQNRFAYKPKPNVNTMNKMYSSSSSLSSSVEESSFLEYNDPEEDKYPFPGPHKMRPLRRLGYIIIFTFSLLRTVRERNRKQLESYESLVKFINIGLMSLRSLFLAEGSILIPMKTLLAQEQLNLHVTDPGFFGSRKSQLSEVSKIIKQVIDVIINLPASTEQPVYDFAIIPFIASVINGSEAFPTGFLWRSELRFTDQYGLIEPSVKMIIINTIIVRVICNSILLDEAMVDYLSGSQQMPSNAFNNLKILATLLYRIARGSCSEPVEPLVEITHEMETFVYSDEYMKYMYKKLANDIAQFEADVREWISYYISNINNDYQRGEYAGMSVQDINARNSSFNNEHIHRQIESRLASSRADVVSSRLSQNKVASADFIE